MLLSRIIVGNLYHNCSVGSRGGFLCNLSFLFCAVIIVGSSMGELFSFCLV